MFKYFEDEKCCCAAQHLFSLWRIDRGNCSQSVQSQHPVSNNCSESIWKLASLAIITHASYSSQLLIARAEVLKHDPLYSKFLHQSGWIPMISSLTGLAAGDDLTWHVDVLMDWSRKRYFLFFYNLQHYSLPHMVSQNLALNIAHNLPPSPCRE